MGWWDSFYSFTGAIDDKLWYIKYQLEDWTKNIADTAVRHANNWFNILDHSWDEVKDYTVTAAAVAVDMMQDKLDDMRSEINNVKSQLDNKIDSTKNVLLASMSRMENVSGAARAALERELSRAIDAARNEASSAIRAIKSTTESTLARMEREFDSGLTLLKTMLNASISAIEREAREARNILEGNLIYALDSAEAGLDRAMSQLEDTIRQALGVIGGRVDWLEGWVAQATGWFDTEINKYKDRVIGWIVDGFEGILDRVFK